MHKISTALIFSSSGSIDFSTTLSSFVRLLLFTRLSSDYIFFSFLLFIFTRFVRIHFIHSFYFRTREIFSHCSCHFSHSLLFQLELMCLEFVACSRCSTFVSIFERVCRRWCYCCCYFFCCIFPIQCKFTWKNQIEKFKQNGSQFLVDWLIRTLLWSIFKCQEVFSFLSEIVENRWNNCIHY